MLQCSQAPAVWGEAPEPGNKGKKRKYQFGAFREEEKCNMMHMKDHKRFKMAKSSVKYFRKSTARPQLI